eukprot:2994343-Pleurochrysis_carterae.AAC.1
MQVRVFSVLVPADTSILGAFGRTGSPPSSASNAVTCSPLGPAIPSRFCISGPLRLGSSLSLSLVV